MASNFTVEEPLLDNVQHGSALVSTRTAGVLSHYLDGLSTWTIVLSLLLAAVVYDQGMLLYYESNRLTVLTATTRSQVHYQQGSHRRNHL